MVKNRTSRAELGLVAISDGSAAKCYLSNSSTDSVLFEGTVPVRFIIFGGTVSMKKGKKYESVQVFL